MVFDEVYIYKQMQRVGDKIYGLTTLGDIDNVTRATQILAFMLVSVDLKWKIPIGYFPINKLNAPQKSRLITKVIEEIQYTGINIIGLTFDGAKVNFKAMSLMGSNLNNDGMDSYSFTKNSKIYVYPDPCHMLKLIRNTLAEYDLVDDQGRLISFIFIKRLVELQEEEGVVLGNRLKAEHVQYKNKIMNVKLAAQVLSNSVAEAIDICRDKLRLPQFADSCGTSNFLRIFNNAFDILNSRNMNHTG